MSEYQYYEFLAIDKRLTSKEQAAVREYSSRAEISATSFSNEYNYGDFKGKPDTFIQKWFDAHVYVANWGTRRFMLGVPKDLIDLPLAKACCDGEVVTLELRGEKAIFTLALEPDDGGNWESEDGSGWMEKLAPARDELLRGDLRIFYLGWLLRMQNGELDADDVEPFVPAGLSKLSKSLKGLVQFLEIDPDVIAFAAEKSEAPSQASTAEEFAEWVVALPVVEKDALLLSICNGEEEMGGVRLRRRFEASRPKSRSAAGHRTVRELMEGAARQTEERERKETEIATARRAREKAESEALRAAHLDELAGREPATWRKVEELIGLRNTKAYDEAVALLRDLRDLAAKLERSPEYGTRVNHILAMHANKKNFVDRLRKIYPK